MGTEKRRGEREVAESPSALNVFALHTMGWTQKHTIRSVFVYILYLKATPRMLLGMASAFFYSLHIPPACPFCAPRLKRHTEDQVWYQQDGDWCSLSHWCRWAQTVAKPQMHVLDLLAPSRVAPPPRRIKRESDFLSPPSPLHIWRVLQEQ